MCVCVCLFTFEVQINGIFAPTFRSQISNIFRYSESLGGNKWKEVVSHLNVFVWKWSKIAAQKKVFFFCADFALQHMVETMLPDGLETSGRRVYR